MPPVRTANYPAPLTHQVELWQQTLHEVNEGKVWIVEAEPRWIHPLHIREQGTKMRIIDDLSAPDGLSLNEVADARPFRMMSHTDALALIQPGCYMAKADIKGAFRQVGVFPEHRELLGFRVRNPHTAQTIYCVHNRMPFGLKCSSEIFCRLSHAIKAMLNARGIHASVVYVDDFLIIGLTEHDCNRALDVLIALLRSLGLEDSPNKTERATQDIIFLGLRIETNVNATGTMRASVPPEKMDLAQRTAHTLLQQRVISVGALQSAIGYFQHVAKAIYSARAFIRRLTDALRMTEAHGQRQVRVTHSLRLDLTFWTTSAAGHNGTAIVLQQPMMATGFWATDASGTLGMGGFYAGRFFSVAWSALQDAAASLPRSAHHWNQRVLWPSATDGIEYKELFAYWWSLHCSGERQNSVTDRRCCTMTTAS